MGSLAFDRTRKLGFASYLIIINLNMVCRQNPQKCTYKELDTKELMRKLQKLARERELEEKGRDMVSKVSRGITRFLPGRFVCQKTGLHSKERAALAALGKVTDPSSFSSLREPPKS